MIPKHVFMIMTSLFLDTKPKADEAGRTEDAADTVHRVSKQ